MPNLPPLRLTLARPDRDRIAQIQQAMSALQRARGRYRKRREKLAKLLKGTR